MQESDKVIKEELERHGMKLGPATALVNFAKECFYNTIQNQKDLKVCR
jgi:hypothetical protein